MTTAQARRTFDKSARYDSKKLPTPHSPLPTVSFADYTVSKADLELVGEAGFEHAAWFVHDGRGAEGVADLGVVECVVFVEEIFGG